MSDPKAEDGLALLLASADRKLPHLVTRTLANEGISHRIYWVADADLLIPHAQTLEPELILVDTRVDSQKLLLAIAELARILPRIPVIVIRDEDTMLPVGACDGILLPLRRRELAAAVTGAAGTRSAALRDPAGGAGDARAGEVETQAASGRAAQPAGAEAYVCTTVSQSEQHEELKPPAPRPPAEKRGHAEEYVFATAGQAGQQEEPEQSAPKPGLPKLLRNRPVRLLTAALIVALVVGVADLVLRGVSGAEKPGPPGPAEVQTAAANPVSQAGAASGHAGATAQPVAALPETSEAPSSPRAAAEPAPEAVSTGGAGEHVRGSEPGAILAAPPATDEPGRSPASATSTPGATSPTATIYPTTTIHPTATPARPAAAGGTTRPTDGRQVPTAPPTAAPATAGRSATATSRPAPAASPPSPAASRPTAQPQPPSAPQSATRLSAPSPVNPASGSQIRGPTRFEWLPTGPLPAGSAYEVVWWKVDEDPASARGIAPPVRTTWLTVDLDVLYQGHQLSNNQIYWAVLIVQTAPYARLMNPAQSVAQALIYQP